MSRGEGRRCAQCLLAVESAGILLTYAAGQEAAYAIWIAERFRPEHRSALEWANRNSIEGVGYFGLRVEGLQIDTSPVAVQLVNVVAPDQWAKQAVQATSTLTARNQLYMAFSEPLCDQIKERFPGWTNRSTSRDSWIDLPTGRTYPWYSLAFTGDKRLRIKLYVDGPDASAQLHLWEQFTAQRDQIDEELPGLTWAELEGSRSSRIALYAPFPASVDREDEWEAYRNWILDNLGPFRTVFQPRIDHLAPYQPMELE